MKRRLFADFLLAFGLLLAAELAVRLFLPYDVSGRFSYGYDREAGFVESGEMVRLVRAGGRRFHPQTFSRQRPPETLRIMVVGDSVPRGPSLAAAYPARLKELLATAGLKAEVINLAVPGFGVRRCRLVLEKILQYEPSLIIWHLNDSNEYEDEREYRRSQEFQGWHPRHWLMQSFILARAYEIKTEKLQWRLLPEKIRQQQMLNDADAELAASLDEAQQRVWRQRLWQTTQETVALIQARGIPVILVIQASRQLSDHGPERLDDQGLEALGHSLQSPGVQVVSMRQVFAHLNPLAPYFADSAHLTPAGHQRLAAALTDIILKRGWTAGNGTGAENASIPSPPQDP
ncbi:MAG: SGNH/GDSL hydrolase family protein [Desulfobacca sp.]|uniref:SGNH/GDSL hydrolase family protein n=1 Tax=Desulfobacca sp. TaxID=2067990 RepID=UPI00404AA6F5